MDWISVKDEMPKLKEGNSETVLAIRKCDNDFVQIMSLRLLDGELVWCTEYGLSYALNSVSYWMPLPKLPEK